MLEICILHTLQYAYSSTLYFFLKTDLQKVVEKVMAANADAFQRIEREIKQIIDTKTNETSAGNICNLKNVERHNVATDIPNCVDGIKDKEAAKAVMIVSIFTQKWLRMKMWKM